MLVIAIFATVVTLNFASCKQTAQDKQNETVIQTKTEIIINKQEVLDIQNKWGDGIIKIGKIYSDKGDYKTAALNQINEFYGYNMGIVLFKPTMASKTIQDRQRRSNVIFYRRESKLS